MSNNRVQARRQIERLVEAFRANASDYGRSNSTYNETQLRTDFLDSLFQALGWDIDNTKGLPMAAIILLVGTGAGAYNINYTLRIVDAS